MNKADLVQAIEGKLGSRKAATDAVETILETIVAEVSKGGKVALTGFGTFEKAARAARTGRNPRTGETVKIRKTSVPRFTASAKFKDYVKNPKSLPKSAPLARASSAAAKTAAAPAKPTARKAAPANAAATKAAPAKAAAKTATKAAAKKTATTKAAATKAPAKKAPARKSAR